MSNSPIAYPGKPIHWQRIARSVLLVVVSLYLAGCGGGNMSQSDMMQYAIRRPADDESAISSATKAQTTASKPAVASAEEPERESIERPPASTASADASNRQNDAESHASEPRDDSPSPRVIVDNAPPEEPLTPEEQVQRSAENMQKIADAIMAYKEDNNVFPPAARYDVAGTPLLSWRVELLRYLGYEDLYRQFNLREPFYTPHNKALVEKIPPVFQSPNRFDTKTNYLAIVGGSAAFDHSRRRGVHPRRFEDGPNNTVLIVEVDDEAAVTWTKPEDYKFRLTQPTHNVGKLRGGNFFVVWGSGMLGVVPASAPKNRLAAMYTRDGGEEFAFSMVNRPVEFMLQGTAQPSSSQVAVTADTETTQGGDSAESESTSNTRHAPSATTFTSAVVANGGQNYVEEYLTAAADEYLAGQPGDAMAWWYASGLVSRRASEWHDRFVWFPALRRPRPTLLVAVGVTYSGRMNEKKVRRAGVTARTLRQETQKQRAEIVEQTEPFGEPLLLLFDQHVRKVAPDWLAQHAFAHGPDPRKRAALQKGNNSSLVFLGKADASQLVADAVDACCDLLVRFDVSDSTVGTSRTVQVTVVDIEKRKEILQSPKMIWKTVGPQAPFEEEEGFRKALWQIEDLLTDGLSPQPWPTGLRPEHALKRVDILAMNKRANPLLVLAEMTVYRDRGLIDDEQLLAALERFAGTDNVVTLMLGAGEKRHRILRQWLPTQLPQSVAATGRSPRAGTRIPPAEDDN